MTKQDIISRAKEHQGEFLLPISRRRASKGRNQYAKTASPNQMVCGEIVDEGLATWIPDEEEKSPGIRLTDKAYHQEDEDVR